MGKSDRILTLDIGASALKLAEFRSLKSGGIELIRFAVGSLGMDLKSEADRPAYIVTTLRELMLEKGIKPGPVYLSLPGQSVFSRFVKLPPVDADKLHQIVLYEAQQNVPFPMDEVVWDYQLLGASGELDVMLAAVKSEVVQDITDCVGAGGLRTELVDVSPMALYNTVRYNYDDLTECALIVDIGARSTDLIFIEQGFFFNRSIPVAGNAITQQVMREFNMDFAEAEVMKQAHAFVAFGGAYESPTSEVSDKVSKSVRLVMTRLHAEINRSINFYLSQQGGSRPTLILLAGGSSIIPHTETFLKEKLKVEVDYLNPVRNVVVAPDITEEDIGNSVHLIGSNIGLALRTVLSCPIEINLIPESEKQKKAFRKKLPMFFIAAIGIIVLLLVWSAFYVEMTSFANKQLEQIGQRVSRLSAVESQLKRVERDDRLLTDKLDELFGLVESRTDWLRLLDIIRTSLPDGMWLTSVTPVLGQPAVEGRDRRRGAPEGPPQIIKLELSGVGYLDKVSSAQPIREFRDRLRESDGFTDKTEISRQPSPQPGDYLREFQLLVVLENPIPQ